MHATHQFVLQMTETEYAQFNIQLIRLMALILIEMKSFKFLSDSMQL